jgi:uncharacterized phiE125 gp8 family phage protein
MKNLTEWRTTDLQNKKYQFLTITDAEPQYEPVSLELVKNYLKVDYTTDNDLIEALIHSARKQIEAECGSLAIVRRSVTQKQTGGLQFIDLMRQPVNSITSVTYYESFDSTGEVIPATDYRFSDGILIHKDGYWKSGRDADGYVIVYNAGITLDTGQSAENSPHTLRTAIMRLIAFLYENREQYVTGINEGNLSVSYDQNMRKEINMLIMPYHTGKAVF